MNWDAIIAVTEIVGVVAVVVSLVYVGIQVRQNTLQLRQDNLRQTVRGTLDSNWLYHRDERALEVFRRAVRSFDDLEPNDQALFHSIVVDIAFYFEVVRQLAMAGLIDQSAVDINQRFLTGILVTPGGREWLKFAEDTMPMPEPALAYLKSAVESGGDAIRPITELQPWLAADDRSPD